MLSEPADARRSPEDLDQFSDQAFRSLEVLARALHVKDAQLEPALQAIVAGAVQTVSPARLTASLGALQNFASFVIASAAPVVTGSLLDHTHSFTLSFVVCAAVTMLGALSYATLAAPGGMHLEDA